ncbi:MAG: hypothetical protein J6S67_24795 [Methanobrevibacter sp.]|nr:hypothetical protein [Methanobrevibacter sp.]
MEVQFFYNLSDPRCINKSLIEGSSFEGQARDQVSIMNPVVLFDTENIIKYNYAYIPEFERYYSIDNIVAYRNNLYEVTMTVDVLMSFRRDILDCVAVVDKQAMQENGDEYIDDGSLVTENVMFTEVLEFEDGFNDSVEYILIVAG